ncbi:MAG: RNA methyltransferase [Chloroflexota bacterium]
MIESPSNPIVKDLQALNAAKRRRERGLFLVEGVRLVEDGLGAGLWPQVCLYNEESLRRTERGRNLLRLLRDPRAAQDHRGSVQEASERAIQAAANTEHPQGVVAAFAMPKWDIPATAEGRALALVCDNIQDPGNMGTILRTAEAAGVVAVILTPESADIYNPKVVRAGMGAHFRLPTFPDQPWANIEALLTKLSIPLSRGYATDAGAPHAYDTVDWTVPSTLIVSNEAHGPSPAARAYAERAGGFISIPMQGHAESLNAASAAAIILFEAARQRRATAG